LVLRRISKAKQKGKMHSNREITCMSGNIQGI